MGSDTRQRAAALDADMRRHRWVVLKMSMVSMTWVPSARRRLLGEIGIEAGQRVLDHCTGTGDNLPALAGAVGPSGQIVGIDLAPGALARARRVADGLDTTVDLLQAEVTDLPFPDASFDAVVHYGAVNQFGSQTGPAVDEMLRVARPGAAMVVLDEGLPARRRHGIWGRTLIRANPLFASHPPLDLLAQRGIHPSTRWVMGDLFYELRFRAPG